MFSSVVCGNAVTRKPLSQTQMAENDLECFVNLSNRTITLPKWQISKIEANHYGTRRITRPFLSLPWSYSQMPLLNKRSSPKNISQNRQTRSNALPDGHSREHYHEIALQAVETGQKPQEDVIHSWLQDVRARLGVSSRINKVSPTTDVDHEASWKPLVASPKTQKFLKPRDDLPPPQILSRDVLLHSSPPKYAKTASRNAATRLTANDRKIGHSSEVPKPHDGPTKGTTFQKRPRHKTRPDRYETRKRRHQTDRNTSLEKKRPRETIREPRPRSGQEIMKNFASSYIGQGRIALKPKLVSGLFANGKGSDIQPMFNLKFAETVFATEHAHNTQQPDSDWTKHKRTSSKDIIDATGFFDKNIFRANPHHNSRSSGPATPFHEQVALFVPSSAPRKSTTNEIIVKSIEDVHPSQQIVAETPYSKPKLQKHTPSVSKTRSALDATSRWSALRISTKHISSASNVSLATTPCRTSRINNTSKEIKNKAIEIEKRTNQATQPFSKHQWKTQTDAGTLRPYEPPCQISSKPPLPHRHGSNTSYHSNREQATQFNEQIVDNRRLGAKTHVIVEQSRQNHSSELQRSRSPLKQESPNFLSSFRPPKLQQIWDADSIDAAIDFNPQYFEPSRYNEHIKTGSDLQMHEPHRTYESETLHVRQPYRFAHEGNHASGPIGFEQGTASQAKAATAVAAVTTTKEARANYSEISAKPNMSFGAMREFWTPNYLM